MSNYRLVAILHSAIILSSHLFFCNSIEVVYHENSAPVYIFADLTITSVETDYLQSATVKLLTEVSK